MKYKVGDRVKVKSIQWFNENSDDNYNVVFANGWHFSEPMSIFCGKELIIERISHATNPPHYIMKDNIFAWTDEMIEGLVEEENKPEFKVGDKITNGKTQLTILQITSNKYVVDDSFGECGTLYFNTHGDWKLVEEETKPKFKVGDKVKDKNNRVWFIVRVSETFFDISRICAPNAQGYFVPMEDQDDYELVPQCFSNDIEIKRNACQKCVFAVYDDNPHCGLRGFTTSFNVERCSAENDTVPNGYELQEDGYFSWVEKKKEYPKTYCECKDILGLRDIDDTERGYYKTDLIDKLQMLLICRDAYWKIAGEEMGLGKPWEPDWEYDDTKYVLFFNKNEICHEMMRHTSYVLAFPTEEMRDAFYENFKELIKMCKELL